MPATDLDTTREDTLSSDRVNADFWAKTHLVRAYEQRNLRPAEVAIMLTHREDLAGRVLEVGCGAGRLTGYLQIAASEAVGIDVSDEMVDYCRAHYPGMTFKQGDMREVGDLEEGPFDAVFASFNVIDALGPDDRHVALDAFHEAVKPGGLLVMSSHNRAYAPDVVGPVEEALNRLKAGDLGIVARTAPRLVRQMRNHRQVRRFERSSAEYALLNDAAHDFALLMIYMYRGDQERQLAEHGFEVLECLDLDGNRLPEGEQAEHCPELHYVARRSA